VLTESEKSLHMSAVRWADRSRTGLLDEGAA